MLVAGGVVPGNPYDSPVNINQRSVDITTLSQDQKLKLIEANQLR